MKVIVKKRPLVEELSSKEKLKLQKQRDKEYSDRLYRWRLLYLLNYVVDNKESLTVYYHHTDRQKVSKYRGVHLKYVDRSVLSVATFRKTVVRAREDGYMKVFRPWPTSYSESAIRLTPKGYRFLEEHKD